MYATTSMPIWIMMKGSTPLYITLVGTLRGVTPRR